MVLARLGAGCSERVVHRAGAAHLGMQEWPCAADLRRGLPEVGAEGEGDGAEAQRHNRQDEDIVSAQPRCRHSAIGNHGLGCASSKRLSSNQGAATQSSSQPI